MDLIQQYRDNLKNVRALNRENSKLKDDKQKQISELSWEYREKIHALEKERNDKTSVLENKFDTLIAANDSEITQKKVPLQEIETILLHLTVKPKEVVWEDSAIHPMRRWNQTDYFIQPLDMIYSDPWLKIKAFILENKKPVNKYTLCLFGRCLFTTRNDRRRLLKFPHDYGVPGNHTDQQISVPQKDFPTVKAAEACFEKNKQNLLTSFIKEYKEVKETYQKIITTYTLKDFRPLFTFECKACGFFLTPMTEDEYTLREGECPDCGITEAEADKIVNCANKDLPLYVSETWPTTAGKEFYDRRMKEVMIGKET